jgi:Protein of unknwon function (DUF3310)
MGSNVDVDGYDPSCRTCQAMEADAQMSETFHEPPNYYNRGGYHCFDVMDALGMFTKYYIASAFTYIWRCDFKGDEAEALRDLKKARRYLDWEIKRRETANKRTSHSDPQPASIQPPIVVGEYEEQ